MSRLVGLQAPDFTATAVVDQEFKQISLSQYRGKYVVLFFLPPRLHLCLPNGDHRLLRALQRLLQPQLRSAGCFS